MGGTVDQETRFIGETIRAQFDDPPGFQKKPGCPNRIVWQGETLAIVEVLSEWQDFERKGRMARNMQAGHAEQAGRQGSWGVGRSYFRVRTDQGRVYELYYDRNPSKNRKGEWFLYRELSDGENREG